MRRLLLPFVLITILFITACGIPSTEVGVSREWEMIEDSGKNTTVNLYAWDGDEEANDWIDTYLEPKLLERYNITLKRVPMEYNDIFSILEKDQSMENNMGEIDLLWISGDSFKYAYNKDYLYGPFTDKLPNFEKYLKSKDKEVMYDLMYPTNGFEAPFGKSQFVLYYNEDILFEAPKTTDEFLNLAKENPGMFTYPAPPDINGSAFVRSIVYSQVGYKEFMDMEVNKANVKNAIEPALSYLKSIEPYLWKKGLQYPQNSHELDQLFMDGELMMSMNFDHNHGTDMIKEFLYPDGTKPFFLEDTMVGRTHYLAIPFNSTNKSGSMVAINYCLSVEAQASKFKLRTWGDIPVLDRDLMTTEEIRLLNKSVTKKTSPKLDPILDNRVPDMSTDIKKIIDEIWIEEFGQQE